MKRAILTGLACGLLLAGCDDTPKNEALYCPTTLEGTLVVDFADTPPPKILAVLEARFEAQDTRMNTPPEFFATTVDLNNDGREDLLTHSRHPFYCGSGGCQVDAYIQKKNGNYDSVFLFPGTEGKIHVMPETHNGYRMLMVRQRDPKEPNHFELYTWTGEAYEMQHGCELTVTGE